jgi:endonuclease YncB( thermonuclease family)
LIEIGGVRNGEKSKGEEMAPVKFRRLFARFCLLVVLALAAPAAAGQYKVTRVVDGDTIVIREGELKTLIRLVGIDAPETSKRKNEPGQPFGQVSTQHLASLVLNRTVEIKTYGLDRYGRVLGEVFQEGRNINLMMVAEGLAETYRGRPAKGQDMDPYRKAENEAKIARKGMWAMGERYASPMDWRKAHQN